MATTLRELIDDVNADDLPTNEFTIEDKDPMVILGKLNEVIAYLETLAETIDASDTKATQALANSLEALTNAQTALTTAQGIDGKATQALEDALEALSKANEALSDAENAVSVANTALSNSNTAITTANSATGTAQSADTKADTAITTANQAKATAEGIDAKATQALTTAQGIDGKATQALEDAQTASETANDAKEIAEEALQQVVQQAGTKVYVGGVLQSTFNADTKADLTRLQTLESDVGTLETNLSSLESDVGTLETNVGTLQTNVSSLQTNVSSLQTNVSSLQTSLNGAISVNNTQNGRLDTLETMVDDISEELDTQQQSINNLSTTLGNHTAQIITINNGITALNNNKQDNLVAQSVQAGTTRRNQNDTIKEYWVSSDGNSWYIIWASGRKECGAVFSAGSIGGSGTSNYTKTTPVQFTQILTAIANTRIQETASGDGAVVSNVGEISYLPTSTTIKVYSRNTQTTTASGVYVEYYVKGY